MLLSGVGMFYGESIIVRVFLSAVIREWLN